MSFFESEFPTAVGFLASGGPTFSTGVNEGFSGDEQRNRNWKNTRGVWTIDLKCKPQAYFDAVHAFFLVVGGQADAFRFKDHRDFNATGQLLGTGDGTTTVFQLVRNYTSGGRTYVRTIFKPVTSSVLDFEGNPLPDTVNIYDNGALQTPITIWTVDYTTGIVSFATPPAAGHIITADFQFHFPVRFTSDELRAQIEESYVEGGLTLITWPNFELREVKILT
jgi:uncharacterized protein (TIGR02217 family)